MLSRDRTPVSPSHYRWLDGREQPVPVGRLARIAQGAHDIVLSHAQYQLELVNDHRAREIREAALARQIALPARSIRRPFDLSISRIRDRFGRDRRATWSRMATGAFAE
jgi:hypothetical protein